ncbi:MAG: flagella basal body P-ring formation protein FlgA [Nitrospirae bacterium]|jgi:flagella basal body P-ring formation protein FlgA|nr:flagella basal body P-ring formation protein FlgA [Nitrospirota bacterium]
MLSASILVRFAGVIGIFFFFSGSAFSGTPRGEKESILIPKGDASVRVDKRALDRLVSGLLDVPPGSLSYVHLPEGFPVSDARGVKGEVEMEGRDRFDSHLALLVKKGDVVEEMFYFSVRMTSRAKRISGSGPGNVGGGHSREGGGVRSGDTVRIQAVGRGFMIFLSGIAQENGHTGDQIAVFNPMSGARVQATVTGPDRVRIRLKGTVHAAE